MVVLMNWILQVRIRAKRVHQFARMRAFGDLEHRIWAQKFHRCRHDDQSRRRPGRQGRGASIVSETLPHLSSHTHEQTYVFEIVEVVPDLESDMKRSFKLRLRCRDEAKGPVTAVCGIDGYLVSSMGQKVSNTSERAE